MLYFVAEFTASHALQLKTEFAVLGIVVGFSTIATTYWFGGRNTGDCGLEEGDEFIYFLKKHICAFGRNVVFILSYEVTIDTQH